ncbi:MULTISPECIES: adenosine deaminase [unclassified Nocardia]|uniref:adenosine deaminase n=1 Tax=unclassified Nocardia TaxID=2637762 RepID=UPI001CE42168|nr:MULTISPECIES: adenosine deaminase [unclassified Nocardia]
MVFTDSPDGRGQLADDASAALLASLPKVELHVHLLGSAAVDTVAELAACRPEAGVPADPDELRRYFRFTDFAHFLAVYTALNRLVTSGSAIVALVCGLGEQLAADNVRYAEVTVTPLSHLRVGIPDDELAQALSAGRRLVAERHGIHLNWIFDVAADDGAAGAFATLDWILRQQPDGAVGFGLGGPEAGAPRRLFRAAFAKARANGLHAVPHAGETSDADEIWSAACDLGAERIGHGIRAVGDRALLDHLADRGITLEVCPSSNVCTGAVPGIGEHPLPALLAAGVPITLGSDDPALFATSLNREYRLCHEEFDIPPTGLFDIVASGIDAAFCPPWLARDLHRDLAQARQSFDRQQRVG